MGCVYLNSLGLYLDHELAEAEKANLEAHIKGCPECLGELALLRLAGDSIRANRIETDLVDFLGILKNKIIEDKKIKEEKEVAADDFTRWSKKFIPLSVVLTAACWVLLLMPVDDNPIEEYIFGKNLSDISNLIDQPGNNLG